MSAWSLAVFLDQKSGEPVYLQIAHALMREIHRGRLKPGDALPGYRSLAEQLAVSRNTVMAAYQELKSEGFITSAPGADMPKRLIPSAMPSRPTYGAHVELTVASMDTRLRQDFGSTASR